MPTKVVGLYIGKFQPFHNGHLHAIKQILNEVDSLIIAIGSSQYKALPEQPFFVAQRRKMIEGSLKAEALNGCQVIEVTDIHDNARWVDHVLKHAGKVDVVFSNNDLVKQLFSEKSFKVVGIKILPGVSGTLVRQKLDANQSDWTGLVPAASAKIIASLPSIKRTDR